jgi:hypothetical protein
MVTTLLARAAIGPKRAVTHSRSGRTLRGSPRRNDPPRSGWPIATQALALPFDLARSQYARAVRAGLIERSLLANAEFERTLGALERFALGPWARRV